MPTASDQVDAEWSAVAEREGIGRHDFEEYLEKRGFLVTREFEFARIDPPTKDEWWAIAFAVEEWDYSGYRRLPENRSHGRAHARRRMPATGSIAGESTRFTPT